MKNFGMASKVFKNGSEGSTPCRYFVNRLIFVRMRILVTGASGQLGTCLQEESRNSPNEYIFTDIDDVDITDAEAVELCVKVNNFDVIVNCAAYPDVVRAERQEAIAELINADGVKHLAYAAKESGIPLIHISCACVLTGNNDNEPYSETQPMHPAGAYGRTKMLGDKAVMKSGCRYIILRTGWLYSEFGYNCVKSIFDHSMVEEKLCAPIDRVGTPTYARDLAKAIISIIDSNMIDGNEGLYNYCSDGICSYYDVAREVVCQSGHVKCEVVPCRSSNKSIDACGSPYSALDNTKFKQTFGLKVPYWTDSISEAVGKLVDRDL